VDRRLVGVKTYEKGGFKNGWIGVDRALDYQ